ncbi:MAG: Imm8 family immunity protein [Halomonadaceae bacterium]|jgi:hypothetical protein
MHARLKNIMSPDLDYGSSPDDPENCRVMIEAEIGPSENEGANIFSFAVITPPAIRSLPAPSWLRGYLLLPVFSWAGVEEAVNKLLMQCAGSDWDEAASKSSQNLAWEFESYVPHFS